MAELLSHYPLLDHHRQQGPPPHQLMSLRNAESTPALLHHCLELWRFRGLALFDVELESGSCAPADSPWFGDILSTPVRSLSNTDKGRSQSHGYTGPEV